MPNTSPHLEEMETTCESIAGVNVGETHKLASKLWDLSINYFKDVRKQAQQSFYSALGAAIVGTIFFFLALYLMMNGQVPFSKLSLIAGMMIQIISAINFYLYAKTSKQFSMFHACLERANRFLLANTICENLDDENKQEMRKEIIRIIATAPLLTLALVEHGIPTSESDQRESLSKQSSQINLNSMPQQVSTNGETEKALARHEANSFNRSAR
jgi:hypothetical protein